jgi:phage terminase Nu1 subunit (DNA packaging protein)
MLVSQKQIADIFGVSTRAVRDWDNAGCPSIRSAKTKQYETSEVIAWRVQREIKAALEEGGADINDEEVREATRRQQIAKAEQAQADAEIKYIELAKRRGEVIPLAKAEDLVSDALAEFSQALDRIPYRYPAQLGSCRNDNERREVLRQAINEVRVTISRLELNRNDDDNDETGGDV